MVFERTTTYTLLRIQSRYWSTRVYTPAEKTKLTKKWHLSSDCQEFLPGKSGLAQSTPKLVTPTRGHLPNQIVIQLTSKPAWVTIIIWWSHLPSRLLATIPPPESPWQVSVPPLPAHSCLSLNLTPKYMVTTVMVIQMMVMSHQQVDIWPSTHLLQQLAPELLSTCCHHHHHHQKHYSIVLGSLIRIFIV